MCNPGGAGLPVHPLEGPSISSDTLPLRKDEGKMSGVSTFKTIPVLTVVRLKILLWNFTCSSRRIALQHPSFECQPDDLTADSIGAHAHAHILQLQNKPKLSALQCAWPLVWDLCADALLPLLSVRRPYVFPNWYTATTSPLSYCWCFSSFTWCKYTPGFD